MTLAVQRFPARRTLGAAELADMVRPGPGDQQLAFGDDRIIGFFAAVSQLLLRSSITRRHPELAALGFFLRRPELRRRLAAIADEPARRHVPRGLVCHFPPGNVPALFAYSWALSAVAGNANVVRLPTRHRPLTEALLDVLAEALPDAPPVVGRTQRLLQFGHHEAVTATLSAACDLRVLWGGDEAVAEIRQHPLMPRARDVTFPDRISFAVISANGWLMATPAIRAQVIRRFFADSYTYDQAACASPLTVHWVGEPGPARRAQSEFVAALADLVRERGPRLDPGTVLDKYVHAYGLAVTGNAVQVRFLSNALTTVDMATPGGMLQNWAGPGVFAFSIVPALRALVPVIGPRHQTITHFGFTERDLASFADELLGRGVDRLIPIGEALVFDNVWDGYDLLREFSRVMTVR